MSTYPVIRQIAVLGAGVMGVQIAAHCANAGFPVLLFDLPTPEDGSRIARNALEKLATLKPAALSHPALAARITPCNYQHDLPRLHHCQLVIETIAERADWKTSLYQQIAPQLADDALLASNTSGLSLELLGQSLPASLQARFCGVHFFNPPRYLRLVELIAHPANPPALLDQLETFLVARLGKDVIRARDTPNFIGNRIGVFSLLATLHHAEALGIPLDVVDDLTGPRLGRPKSATLRTADLVGLDVFAHVAGTLQQQATQDPWHHVFTLPDWLQQRIAAGALGEKTRAGAYRKHQGVLQVWDIAQADYTTAGHKADPEVVALLKLPRADERLAALRVSAHPQARFVWHTLRDTWHYAAYHLADIAPSAREVDTAMRLGFGWEQGPFEQWQAAGWQTVAEAIEQARRDGLSLGQAELPDWVSKVSAVHDLAGSYAADQRSILPRTTLPVYQHQLNPLRLQGEAPPALGKIVLDLPNGLIVRDAGDGLLVATLTSPNRALGQGVIDGLHVALDLCEKTARALVIWPDTAPFSVGADLKGMMPAFVSGKLNLIETLIENFQAVLQRIKYSPVPVVAAVTGYALGGGCELMLHCARVVAHLESYIGLVEAGVGLLPAGGGCAEMALRASQQAGLPLHTLQAPFRQIAMAQAATSAEEARAMGYLRQGDLITLQGQDLLYLALQQARLLADAGYQPPLPARFAVAGADAAATVRADIFNRQAGGFISAHDARIAGLVADVMCGAPLPGGTLVDEAYLLRREREAFMQLVHTPETVARVQHMLETGKPLRN